MIYSVSNYAISSMRMQTILLPMWPLTEAINNFHAENLVAMKPRMFIFILTMLCLMSMAILLLSISVIF